MDPQLAAALTLGGVAAGVPTTLWILGWLMNREPRAGEVEVAPVGSAPAQVDPEPAVIKPVPVATPEAASLITDLEAVMAWPAQVITATPAPVMTTAAELRTTLRAALAYMLTEASTEAQLAQATAIVREYLPAATAPYKALAISGRGVSVRDVTGRSATDELGDQLGALLVGAQRLADSLYGGGINTLATNRRFLQDKFAVSELDLGAYQHHGAGPSSEPEPVPVPVHRRRLW